MTRHLQIFALILASTTIPAFAQEVEEETEIVVTGQRERGAVVGDIKPELQLRTGDIRALGVSSVTELLAELAPQLRSGSGDGQPIVLLEGKRISGFREVANLPAEAIARVDILPEEVALKYGYPLGQKVVNIVLRQRFKAFTFELEDRFATSGGGNEIEGSFDFLRIQKGGRLAVNLERETVDLLLESQRGIDDGTGSGRYRTLLPATQQFTVGATLSRTIFDDVSATLNGEVKTEDSRATFGLPGVNLLLTNGNYPEFLPLARTNGNQTARAATTLNGIVAGWRWTFTGNYDHVESKSLIDRDIGSLQASLPADRARSVSDIAALDLVVTGSPFRMPAGEVSTTLKLGASFSGFSATSLRAGVNQAGRVTRDIADAQLNIDVPLTSRRNNVLSAIGDLSINANYAAQRLSDYGSLRTLGYGLTWSPFKELDLIASVTENEVAPTAQQLGNPVVATPDVRVFDFVRGETAFVSFVTGGNRALTPSDRRIFKLGATLKPFEKPDITLTGDYVSTRSKAVLASLPPASLASQAAFPDRYIRDASGVLVGVDNRTVNFARSDASQFRWGINFSQPLKSSQAQIDALRAAFPRRGRGGAGSVNRERWSGGGGGGGRFGGRGGRLNLAVYHTVHIKDTVTLRDGLPIVDRLNGGTTVSGGQPRHEIEFQAGVSKNGFGARLTGNWQSATRVTGTVAAEDLRFSALGTANLRLFANLGQLPSIIKTYPWLSGTRVTIGISNLFDSRQRVTDGNGATPLGYQPGYLDPLGRTVRISVRKLLF